MRDDDFDDDLERKTGWQRYGLPVGGFMAIAVVGASAFVLLKGGSGPAARPHQEPHITQIQLPPPPPPPPPPKTPPPPKKTEEAVRQREATPQKAEAKPAPKAPSPPAAVTTSIQGNGPGSLAAGNGGGDCIGSGCGTGDGTGGDDDAYYSGLVKTQIEDALRRDEKLKFAKYRMTVSFTLDSAGRLAGVAIASFSGHNDVRAEVEQMLRSISTGDTPPADMHGKQFSVRITERARG